MSLITKQTMFSVSFTFPQLISANHVTAFKGRPPFCLAYFLSSLDILVPPPPQRVVVADPKDEPLTLLLSNVFTHCSTSLSLLI